MEITEIITQFLMPLVLAGCYAIGAALKSTEHYPDKYIPATMLLIGSGSLDHRQLVSGNHYDRRDLRLGVYRSQSDD